MALLATILPGGGHLLLGKSRPGLLLLAASFGLLIPLSAASLLEWEHLQWLCVRALTALYLFGVIDAIYRRYELADGRSASGCSPRLAALGNLLLYGLGYGLLERWPLAIACGLGGLLLHGLFGAQGALPLIVGEVAALALAVHAHRLAAQSPRARGRDTSPAWILPALASFIALHLALLAFSWHAGQELEAALAVDQSEALIVEPYYRNDSYGVQVELNAPGWSFLEAESDEYVHARHVSGDAEFTLRSGPRFFGFPDAVTMARSLLGEGMLSGMSLAIVSEGPARLAGLQGYRIHAQGHLGREVRQVEIVVAGKGWRQYLLWYEWGGANTDFARRELDFLLGRLDVAGTRPATADDLAR